MDSSDTTSAFLVSDLHGSVRRYEQLFAMIREVPPSLVLIAGDILPAFGRFGDSDSGHDDFIGGFLAVELERLRDRLGPAFPLIAVIMGNDDLRACEDDIRELEEQGLWQYIHNRRIRFGAYDIYGYACVPPTPFLLKDWERYDVSRSVEPDSISPEEGHFSVETDPRSLRYVTIAEELAELADDRDLSRSIFVFHTPPYRTTLDRAALDGRMIDHVPLDVHVGSIAVRRFIEERQPLLTVHGHIHESPRLTGSWRDRIGRTHAFTGAHDGPELAVVEFRLDALSEASRTLRPASPTP